MTEKIFSDYSDKNIKKSWDKPHSSEEWNSLLKELNRYKMAWNMAENELEKWKKDLHLQSHVLGFMEGKASQTEEQMMLQKPLSDEEINEVIDLFTNKYFSYHDFARAIEERHGIK